MSATDDTAENEPRVVVINSPVVDSSIVGVLALGIAAYIVVNYVKLRQAVE